MSGPVSYASAASSAAKDPKDPQEAGIAGIEAPVVPTPSSTIASVESTDEPSTTTAATEVEVEASIKEKAILTPAPPPKVNAWNVGSSPASSTASVESSPTAANSELATTEPPLDPQHWPKPDEGTSPGDKKDGVAGKARPGKWVPLNYTPVTGKPRSKATRKPSSAPVPNGAPKGRPKNFAPKTGAKKTEKGETKSDKPKASRTASISSASGKDAKKPAAVAAATGSAAPKPKKESEHHQHHNHHNHNTRSASFNQQFIPYNGRRTSGYTANKFYVPDYSQYQQGYGQVQSQYELTVSTVVYQVEYYFSVENLCKDTYLRKQMNSAGWIPLAILAGFNRLKVLTGGDYNLFLEATKWAPSVEVAGEKIRARANWELWVLPVADRSAAGKDEDVPTVASVPVSTPVSVPVSVTAAPKLVFNPAQAMPFVPKMNHAAPPTAST